MSAGPEERDQIRRLRTPEAPVSCVQIQTDNISESASRSCRRHKARVRHRSDPRALPIRITPASHASSADWHPIPCQAHSV